MKTHKDKSSQNNKSCTFSLGLLHCFPDLPRTGSYLDLMEISVFFNRRTHCIWQMPPQLALDCSLRVLLCISWQINSKDQFALYSGWINVLPKKHSEHNVNQEPGGQRKHLCSERTQVTLFCPKMVGAQSILITFRIQSSQQILCHTCIIQWHSKWL